MEIKAAATRLTHGIRHVEDARLCLERNAHTGAKEHAVQVIARHIVLRPACIEEGEEKGVEAYQVPVFQCPDGILRGEDALFVKPAEELVAANHKQLVAIGIW